MTDLLTKLKKLNAARTPGEWLEREEHDYYQGGTYLGVGPYKYQYNDMRKWGPLPSPAEVADGFEKDVCRIESNDADKEFIAFMANNAGALIEEIERLRARLDELWKQDEEICAENNAMRVRLEAAERVVEAARYWWDEIPHGIHDHIEAYDKEVGR